VPGCFDRDGVLNLQNQDNEQVRPHNKNDNLMVFRCTYQYHAILATDSKHGPARARPVPFSTS
jgi:hypothetical protein